MPKSLNPQKKLLISACVHKECFGDITALEFSWSGAAPRGGQFFLLKPEKSSVFLSRPISAALWKEGDLLRFLIIPRGQGSKELADIQIGERVNIIGPLGNSWDAAVSNRADANPAIAKPQTPGESEKRVALVAGGIGIAPLLALAHELSSFNGKNAINQNSQKFDFFAGFRSWQPLNDPVNNKDFNEASLLASLAGTSGLLPDSICIATEDASFGKKGRITDFFNPSLYKCVYACGPEPMLRAVAKLCMASGTPCFISMEAHMACGVGACLGCSIKTIGGNKCCCSDGPVFDAGELVFND